MSRMISISSDEFFAEQEDTTPATLRKAEAMDRASLEASILELRVKIADLKNVKIDQKSIVNEFKGKTKAVLNVEYMTLHSVLQEIGKQELSKEEDNAEETIPESVEKRPGRPKRITV